MAEVCNTSLFNSANLKADYEFEVLTTDSKNGNTLTNTGTVTQGTGRYGYSADFGSSNSSKVLSLSAPLQTVTYPWSIAFWVKLYSYSSQGPSALVYNGTDANGYGIMITDGGAGAGNKLGFLVGGLGWGDLGYTFSDTNWHHIVVIKESTGTGVKSYVDNTYVAQSAETRDGNTPADKFTIGAMYNGASVIRYANCQIDSVGIFDRALTADERTELYTDPSSTVNSLKFYRRTRIPGSITGV